MIAAIIGGGVIGAGWAARFVIMGWDVQVFDPDPQADRKMAAVLDNARASLPALSDVAPVPEGRLSFHATIAGAVAGATWVQESVPERLDLKARTLAAIQAACPADAIVGSSTSGFKPSELQVGSAAPGQIIVAHPFNPVYLLPLVELVGSPANSADLMDRARGLLTGIGCYPLQIRAEIDAHIADRLLESLWREALWLVRDGIATTAEIDESIRMGFGLRWAQMGLFETYRIAGGEAGMRHFVAQFGPCLQWPWSHMTDVPDMDDALIDRIAAQSDAQSGAHSIRDLERIRDRNLVGILRGLKATGWGAGAVLAAQDRRRDSLPGLTPDAPAITAHRIVPPDWTDYNGHMNEARYLQAMSEACDRFLLLIGVTPDYLAGGHSYFTAETHLRHLGEVRAGAAIVITTQVLGGDGRKLHLFHTMSCDGQPVATAEQLLLHVSLDSRRSCPPGRAVLTGLMPVLAGHARLPRPAGAGRAVGDPPS